MPWRRPTAAGAAAAGADTPAAATDSTVGSTMSIAPTTVDPTTAPSAGPPQPSGAARGTATPPPGGMRPSSGRNRVVSTSMYPPSNSLVSSNLGRILGAAATQPPVSQVPPPSLLPRLRSPPPPPHVTAQQLPETGHSSPAAPVDPLGDRMLRPVQIHVEQDHPGSNSVTASLKRSVSTLSGLAADNSSTTNSTPSTRPDSARPSNNKTQVDGNPYGVDVSGAIPDEIVCKLWIHNDRFSTEQLVINPTFAPHVRVGDLISIYPSHSRPGDSSFRRRQERSSYFTKRNDGLYSESMDEGNEMAGLTINSYTMQKHSSKQGSKDKYSGLLLQVTKLDKDLIQKQPKLQISISQDIASYFGLQSRTDVVVKRVNKSAVVADFLELSFRDQYVGRNDMWRIKLALQGTAVNKGRKLNIMNSRLTVETVYINGGTAASGFITERTKIIFRSVSAKYFIFIQMSKELWEFDEDGELNFEKCLHGFLPDIFARWKRRGCNHVVSIILFTRIFYPTYDPKKEVGMKIDLKEQAQKVSNLVPPDKQSIREPINDTPPIQNNEDPVLNVDGHGRYYRDFYKVVVDWETSRDWNSLIPVLNKEFTIFRRDTLQVPNIKGQDIMYGVNASSADGNILEAVNLALNSFDRHYIDRDLTHTGLSILIVTPGSGIFEVDKYLCRLTAHRMIENGIGLDAICLSRPPLYTVPLLQYVSKHYNDQHENNENRLSGVSSVSNQQQQQQPPFQHKQQSAQSSQPPVLPGTQPSNSLRKEDWDPLYYDDPDPNNPTATFQCIPNWLDCDFWTRDKSIEKFPLRCKMFEVQMMGLMEDVGNNIMVPHLETPIISHSHRPASVFSNPSNNSGLRDELRFTDGKLGSAIATTPGSINPPSVRGIRFDFGSEEETGTTGAEESMFPYDAYDANVFKNSEEPQWVPRRPSMQTMQTGSDYDMSKIYSTGKINSRHITGSTASMVDMNKNTASEVKLSDSYKSMYIHSTGLDPAMAYSSSLSESFKGRSPSFNDMIKQKNSPSKPRQAPVGNELMRFSNINPCNPSRNVMRTTSDIRRWQHVLPLTYNPLKDVIWMNWKSLCYPASLPLTTDYFPTPEQLAEYYQEYTYNVSPADDFATAITARLTQGNVLKGLRVLLQIATANSRVSSLALAANSRQAYSQSLSDSDTVDNSNSSSQELLGDSINDSFWEDGQPLFDTTSIITAPNAQGTSTTRFAGTSNGYAISEIGKTYLLLMELVGQRIAQGFQLIVDGTDSSSVAQHLPAQLAVPIVAGENTVSKVPSDVNLRQVPTTMALATHESDGTTMKMSPILGNSASKPPIVPTIHAPDISGVSIRSGIMPVGSERSSLLSIVNRKAVENNRSSNQANQPSNADQQTITATRPPDTGISTNQLEEGPTDSTRQATLQLAVNKLLEHASVPFYLSLGDNVHKLTYDASGNNIEVKRYVRKLSFSTAPIPYSFYVSPKEESGFQCKSLSFNYPQLSRYNWNYLDHHVSGYQDEMTESLRFWRTRLVLIPAETVNLKSSFLNPKGDNLDEEEIRLVGFEKFMESVERLRWEESLGSDGHYSSINVSKKRKGVRTLPIIPTTLNMSRFIKEEVCNANSNLHSSFPLHDFSVHSSAKAKKPTSSSNEVKLSKNSPANVFLTQLLQPPPFGISITDRRWHFRLYENVMLGNEFIDWVVHNVHDIDTREEAVELGNRYLTQGFFEHVLGKHNFLDGHYFYRVRDEFYEAYGRSSSSEPRDSIKKEREKTPEKIDQPSGSGVDDTPSDMMNPNPQLRSTKPSLADAMLPGDHLPFTGFYGSNTNNQQESYTANDLFPITKSIILDLDQHRRSQRMETAVLHYDTVHNPKVCYHLQLHWLVCSAHVIEELITSWTRTAEKCGLKLVEAGAEQPSILADDNPFQSLYRIKFAVLPDIARLNAELSSKFNFKFDMVFYQFEILNRLGFVLDVESSANFPKNVTRSSYSRGQDYKRTQWISRSGVAFVLLDGNDFLFVPNRMHLTGFGSLTSTNQSHVQQNTDGNHGGGGSVGHSIDSMANPTSAGDVAGATSMTADSDTDPHQTLGAREKDNYSEVNAIRERIIHFCSSETLLNAFYAQVETSLREMSVSGNVEWVSPPMSPRMNDDTINIAGSR